MPITKHNFSVKKTARYFQLGELNESTEHIVIACHGYAQLANYFLKWFEPFDLKNTVIIAPEGLSRFYWNGFSGNVVASWMTKVDREDDISDYVNYLDDIIKSLALNPKVKLTALGFSQGGATVSRWLLKSDFKFNNLVLWAAVFPEDIEIGSLKSKVINPVQILFGDKDQFYSLDQINALKSKLEALESSIDFTIFEGEHKVYIEPLNNLYQKLSLS
jgi:predicted esterase